MTLKAALAAWNDTAAKIGARKAIDLNDRRRRALARRLVEIGGLPAWRELLGLVEASPFLRGERGSKPGHEGWRPNLDWMLRPETPSKLREGNYAETPARAPAAIAPPEQRRVEDWSRRVSYFAKTGVYRDEWFPPRENLSPDIAALFDAAEAARAQPAQPSLELPAPKDAVAS